MATKRGFWGRWVFCVAGMLIFGASVSLAAPAGKVRVAVTEPDIEIIVKAVGGNQVDTFSLFKGCILRKDLSVEPAVHERLLKADAVVWTGFFNESAAINDVLGGPVAGSAHKDARLFWIDVSKAAVRANIPTSTCSGYVDPSLMAGDPFFWLNPENGASIARAAAEGLGDLRPDKRGYFLANAEAFQKDLERDIARWKKELEPMTGLRIFSAQCGWQNFSKLGGPTFVVCKGTPGTLPTPQLLLDHIKEMKAQIILVDPNTPSEYGRAFRKDSGVKVIEVASSVEAIPGARSYSDLFDNLIKTLKEAAH
jgi:ABC-type Zn uptake system ZnuABC Zn-binding protein ZnuA